MGALTVFAHDLDLERVSGMLSVAGIRVVAHPEPGAVHLVPYGESVGVIANTEELPVLYLSQPLDAKAVVAAVRTAAELNAARRAVKEAKDLLEIARALGAERDRRKLYHTIVRKARELTLADSGTLYVLEEKDGKEFLRFAIAQTGPHDSETYEGGTVPVSNTSLAGSVAGSQKPLRMSDVYKDAVAYGLKFDKSFDEKNGYRTKSMLCVPLTSYSGNSIGVLQLMNKKPSFEMPLLSPSITESAVEPFDERDEELITALAAHAGLALHNVHLIEDLFNAQTSPR